MEIKLKWTWRPIIKSKKRLRLKWRTLMELIAHLKGRSMFKALGARGHLFSLFVVSLVEGA